MKDEQRKTVVCIINSVAAECIETRNTLEDKTDFAAVDELIDVLLDGAKELHSILAKEID